MLGRITPPPPWSIHSILFCSVQSCSVPFRSVSFSFLVFFSVYYHGHFHVRSCQRCLLCTLRIRPPPSRSPCYSCCAVGVPEAERRAFWRGRAQRRYEHLALPDCESNKLMRPFSGCLPPPLGHEMYGSAQNGTISHRESIQSRTVTTRFLYRERFAGMNGAILSSRAERCVRTTYYRHSYDYL